MCKKGAEHVMEETFGAAETSKTVSLEINNKMYMWIKIKTLLKCKGKDGLWMVLI